MRPIKVTDVVSHLKNPLAETATDVFRPDDLRGTPERHQRHAEELTG